MLYGNSEARVCGRRRIGLWLFVALAAALLYAGPLHSQEAPRDSPTTLAVLNFVNRNPRDGWDWLGTGLADMLITDLSKSASLAVVERERMAWMLKEMLKEMEMARRGLLDATTAQNVGRICKVDWALFGSFAREGDQLSIEGHIIEVETGALLRVEWVEGKVEDLFALEKELVHRILDRLNVPLSEEERESLRYVPTDSIDALTHYSVGLDNYDNGEYENAVMEFRLALKKDPDYHQARMHLADKYFKIGEPEHALIEYREVLQRDREGHLTEDVYYHMGRVLQKGLGRYPEAISCYEKVVARHPEYSIDRSEVEARMVQWSKIRRKQDPETHEALRLTLSYAKQIAKDNATPNQAMEQLAVCYEKTGDELSAVRYYTALMHFMRHNFMTARGGPWDSQRDRVGRKVDKLYQFVLREGLDDKAPMPAGMMRIAEPFTTVDNDTLSEVGWLALEGGRSGPLLFVAPIGKEFGAVEVYIKMPPSERDYVQPGQLYEHGARPWYHKYGANILGYKQEITCPAGATKTMNFSLPPGVRGIVFTPPGSILECKARSDLTEWRLDFTLRAYQKTEATSRLVRSGCEIAPTPGEVHGVFVDGIQIPTDEEGCSGGIPVSSGEHEARVVWSDGSRKSTAFVIEPDEQEQITVLRDNPFVRLPEPVVARGSHPHLFFDRDGKLWLYWDEAESHRLVGEPSEESDIYFSVSSDEGRTWSKPRMCPVSALGLDVHPILQQDRSGTYWLVWCSGRDISDPLALWMSSSRDGHRWQHPRKLRIPASDESDPDDLVRWRQSRFRQFEFFIDREDVFWLRWQRYLSHSSDGHTWSNAKPLEIGGEDARFQGTYAPQYFLGLSHEGTRFLYAQLGRKLDHGRREGVFAVSSDGRSWSGPVVLQPGGSPREGFVLKRVGESYLLTYVGGKGIFCRLSEEGLRWGEPFLVESNRVMPWCPSLAVSRSGRCVLAYASRQGIVIAAARNLFKEREAGQLASILESLGLSSGPPDGATSGEEEAVSARGDVSPSNGGNGRAKVMIEGIYRVANLSTGVETCKAAEEGIQLMPGDHMTIQVSAHSHSYAHDPTWHYVWTGGEMLPIRFLESGTQSFRELVLRDQQGERVVAIRPAWSWTRWPGLPESSEPYRDLLSLDSVFGVKAPDLDAVSKLSKLRYLNVQHSYDISDLAPLARLTDLRVLNLAYCSRVQNLSPLSRLENLVWLDLWRCGRIADLSPLSALPNLERLRVEVKDADGLAAVSRIKSLTHLDLTCTGDVTDLSPLSSLTNLKSLHLTDFDGVTDLSPLSELEGLASLHLIDCDNVSNLGPLSDLGNLRSLHLWRCGKVSSLSALSEFPTLTYLDLWYCQSITDLSPLSNLENLTSVSGQVKTGHGGTG